MSGYIKCDRCFRRIAPRGMGSHKAAHKRKDTELALQIARKALAAAWQYTDIWGLDNVLTHEVDQASREPDTGFRLFGVTEEVLAEALELTKALWAERVRVLGRE